MDPYLQVMLRLTGEADAGALASLVALFDLTSSAADGGAPGVVVLSAFHR